MGRRGEPERVLCEAGAAARTCSTHRPRAMQSQDRAQVFGVVCRQLGSSVQVLLQKVGRGPPTDRKWAFVGGPVQPGDDTGVRLSDALSTQLSAIVPPSSSAPVLCTLLRILRTRCSPPLGPILRCSPSPPEQSLQ